MWLLRTFFSCPLYDFDMILMAWGRDSLEEWALTFRAQAARTLVDRWIQTDLNSGSDIVSEVSQVTRQLST